MKIFKLVSFLILLSLSPLAVYADGTETLGAPSIGIAGGTDVIVAGTGLCDQCTAAAPNPGTIDINIPAGASIQQVLLYWHGANFNNNIGPAGTAMVSNGGPVMPVNGTVIGGPTVFFSNVSDLTYRADITALGLIGPGANTISIETSFVQADLGAGLLVIVDDGSDPSDIELRDGQDLAFINFAAPLDSTVPQTYNFAASSDPRNAEIAILSGSAQDARGDIVRVTIDAVITDFANVLDANDGAQFDALEIPIVIPAGATSLTVELISGPALPADSLSWLSSALQIEPPDQPGPVSIGDRIWEDTDRDGQQDCVDGGANDPMNPADGIIGNAGDAGPECGNGVPNVTVELYSGPDCLVPAGPSTSTDADGFYLFDNLLPGDYCVKFDIDTVDGDFCEVMINNNPVNLGLPQFTDQNIGDDISDSDADPISGITDSIDVPSGSDLTLDAGIFCPAKIGDLVFEDTNEDGIQDPGEPGVPGVDVELVACGPDGIAGTPDDVPTGEFRMTDGTGMYMFGGEFGYELPPGDYYVKFNPATLPPGSVFTTPKQGGDDTVDSDCLEPDGMTSCTDLNASRAVNLDRDCGIIPPPPPTCGLMIDKTCLIEVPEPPPGDFDKCDGRLQQFSVTWTGGPIFVTGPGVDNVAVSTGETVTFVGPFSDNDVFVDISGAQNGFSVFHTSCSDDDFNSPDDCGKAAGNGKSDEEGINLWTLAGFIDDEGRVLNCAGNGDGGNGDAFAQNCEFEKLPNPSCDSLPDKPDTIQFRYDGGGSMAGGCDGSSITTAVNEDGKMHEDFECDGAVDVSMEITVIDDDGASQLVGPGETFSVPRDEIKSLMLIQNAMQQDLEFHSSCSQPLAVGLTAGALTIAGLDNITGGADVTYSYEVSNTGAALSNVMVTDDQLGDIGTIGALGMGESETLTAMTSLNETTVNIGTATGMLADGSMCMASDQVVVEAIQPTCDITAAFDKLDKDEKIKFKVTNNSAIPATLDTLVLNFPGEHEFIKEAKLDGAAYKSDDSTLVVGPGVTIGSMDWTEDDVSKRVLEPGETRTLEIKFEKKFKAERADYSGVITFVEGCDATL